MDRGAGGFHCHNSLGSQCARHYFLSPSKEKRLIIFDSVTPLPASSQLRSRTEVRGKKSYIITLGITNNGKMSYSINRGMGYSILRTLN
jgi:hypothetical protein